jgi:hypothetical protein
MHAKEEKYRALVKKKAWKEKYDLKDLGRKKLIKNFLTLFISNQNYSDSIS